MAEFRVTDRLFRDRRGGGGDGGATPGAVPTLNPAHPSPRYSIRSAGWPIMFYDQVIVVSGGAQAFRNEAFTNNLGVAVELRSMRVMVATATGASATVLGGGIGALEIEIDGVKVTRSAVPIWNLCRSENRLNESLGSGISEWAWYFSHPAPLGPEKRINIQARHLGVVSQNMTVSLAFVGSVSLAPAPRRVPYAAYWETRSFAYAEAATDSTPPAALVNDTGRELHVDRVIGRSIAYDDASGAGAEYTDFGDVSTQGVSSLSLRLGLSQQRPILKRYTQWRAVFGQNAAVETDFDLAPGDYLTADVQHAAGPALGVPFAYSQNKGGLSIVGWREV